MHWHNRKMIYVKRLNLKHEGSLLEHKNAFELLATKTNNTRTHTTHRYTNSIVIFCYLFENKIVNDTGISGFLIWSELSWIGCFCSLLLILADFIRFVLVSRTMTKTTTTAVAIEAHAKWFE